MIIDTSEAWLRWLGEHRPGPVVLDIETEGLSVGAAIAGVGLKYWRDDSVEPIYATGPAMAPSGGAFHDWLREARELHNMNLAFDLTRLQYHWGCVPLRHIECHDVFVLASLAKNATGDFTRRNLDTLARELDPESGKDDEMKAWLEQNGCEKWEYYKAPLPLQERYCVQDLRMVELTEPHWERTAGRLDLHQSVDLEHRLIPVIADLQARGMRLDLEFVATAMDRLAFERNVHLFELKKYADINWSPNSKDLETYLVEHLGLELIEIPKFDKKKGRWGGKVSFDKNARAIYAKQYPEHERMFTLIDKMQRAHTLLGYYVQYAEHAVAGRIHPEFNSLGAVTGRGSSSHPNFQNLTHALEDEGPEYEAKNAVLADTGMAIKTADYSQAELRVLLHYIRFYEEGIQKMIDAVEGGADVHEATAALMLGVPLEEVTKAQRQQGKTMNFAQVYGQGINSLAKNLGVPKGEAKILQRKYFAGLIGIETLKKKVVLACKRNGYIRTHFKRKVHVPSDRTYVGLNYLCQGSVGEGTKRAMLELWDNPPCPGHQILFQVHDDIPQQVPAGMVAEERHEMVLDARIRECMLRPWEGMNIKFDVAISKPQKRWAA